MKKIIIIIAIIVLNCSNNFNKKNPSFFENNVYLLFESIFDYTPPIQDSSSHEVEYATNKTIILKWNQASDNKTAQSNISYQVAYGESTEEMTNYSTWSKNQNSTILHDLSKTPDNYYFKINTADDFFNISTSKAYKPSSYFIKNQFDGEMIHNRIGNRVTKLKNNQVLITGGYIYSSGNYIYLNYSEIYNSSTGIFSFGGVMTEGRHYHTATLLKDGKVLITGGYYYRSSEDYSFLSSAEIYDPDTNTFYPTGNMNSRRAYHSAVLLNDGRVFISGGRYQTTKCEIYDPNTGTFYLIRDKISSPRAGHTNTLLDDGKVLITGGDYYDFDNGKYVYLSSSEIFDPVTQTLSDIGNMNSLRSEHTATLLNNGKVLLAGGHSYNNTSYTYLSSAEIYDIFTKSFTPTGSMNSTRNHHSAVLLNNGKVLITGDRSYGELYDPDIGEFTKLGSISYDTDNEAVLLDNGNVFIGGGSTSGYIYNSDSGLFSSTKNSSFPGEGVGVTLLKNGKILLTGGNENYSYSSSAYIYDPETSTFTLSGTMSTPRYNHTSTLLSNGKVLITGGRSDYSTYLSSAEIYDPDTGEFS